MHIFYLLKGDLCEFGNCNNQPLDCSTSFGPSFCATPSIATYCPLLCSQPICKCGFDSCLNGGVFISSSCLCACPVQYTGIRCENLTVTTTTTTVATKKCSVQLPCMNGAKQNPSTCNCDCKYHHLFKTKK